MPRSVDRSRADFISTSTASPVENLHTLTMSATPVSAGAYVTDAISWQLVLPLFEQNFMKYVRRKISPMWCGRWLPLGIQRPCAVLPMPWVSSHAFTQGPTSTCCMRYNSQRFSEPVSCVPTQALSCAAAPWMRRASPTGKIPPTWNAFPMTIAVSKL